MAKGLLPVPRVDPTIAVDPYRNPAAFIRVLSELFHAENAALEWFRRIDDPAVVQHADIFTGAARMLVRDETAHMRDIEQVIGWLGGGGVLQMSETTAEFWNLVDVRNAATWGGALPLPASVVATFVLLSEGLGYAFLYQLAHSVIDRPIREKLLSNVLDEERHARVSVTLLRRTFERDPTFWLDLGVYVPAYMIGARKAGRAQRQLLAELGFDYYHVTGSSFRFVRELFAMAASESPAFAPRLQPLWSLASDAMYSSAGMRALHAAMYLPEPPAMWRAVRAWTSFRKTFAFPSLTHVQVRLK